MKNRFYCLLLLMVQLAASAAESAEVNKGIAVITGHGEVLPDDYVVTFYPEDTKKEECLVSDTIANGRFRLEVPVGEGFTVGHLYFNTFAFPSMRHKLYLTPGAHVEVDAVDNYLYTWPVKSNVPEQDEVEMLIDNSRQLWIEVQKEIMARDRNKSRFKGTEYLHWSDSVRRVIDLRSLEFLKTRPVGRVWLDEAEVLAKMLRYDAILSEEMRSMYANLDDSLKNTPQARSMHNYLFAGSHLGIGDEIPDVEFFDLKGGVHRFSEFAGKWRLVDFWTGGCTPCIRAIPELKELKDKYEDNLELISLSLDKESDWQKISAKLPLLSNNWNEGKEDYGLFTRLGLRVYPTFLIIDPAGRIRGTWIGYSTGSLKQKVNFFLRSKGATEYEVSDGARTIRFPHYRTLDTDYTLDIDRIEINEEGTKVYFSYVFFPDKPISIPADTYLTDSTGRKYSALGSNGIVLGQKQVADSDGSGSFSITYEAIPEDVDAIDFHEDSSGDGWKIEGIALMPVP
ncbi:MAG: TlpA disulfide reductase family protein [Bacteroidales bacterium]|nr:TlpA disulfide reductase family protein [Bacteroidales bacterium]